MTTAPRAFADGAKLRFAQITDVHLFDAGYKCFAPDVQMEYAENLQAFKWAIAGINKANKTSKIDFVVFTGDLGLENLTLPGEAPLTIAKPNSSGCNPRTPVSNDYGPIKPISVEAGSGEIAGLLGELEVAAIYFVPGNNDLRDEDPGDRKRYIAFISALAAKLPGRIRDLTGETVAGAGDPQGLVNGFRLLGMDSASFKPTADERKSGPASVDPGAIADCEDPHPDSDISTAREKEIERVANAVAGNAAPALLFTHIPDREDPYGPRQKNDAQTCLQRSAWFLNPKALAAWKTVAASPALAGVFTGHFHNSDATLYGKPEKNVLGDAGSTYVAPPLSIRLQWKSSTPQRGYVIYDVADFASMTLKVTPTLVSYTPDGCCGSVAPGTSGKASSMAQHTQFYAFVFASVLILLVFLLGAIASSLQGHGFRFNFALIEIDTNTYSLTKLQFYGWLWLTTFSYSYLALAHMLLQHQFDMPDVPDGLAKLFGISAGSAAGAILANATGRSKGGGLFNPHLSDLISTGGEVASDRAQFLVWSFVAIFGYYLKVVSTDPAVIQVLPDLPSNLLLLSGISSGGYLLGRFARTPGPVMSEVTTSSAPDPQPAAAPNAVAGAVAGNAAGAVAAGAVAAGQQPADAAIQGAAAAIDAAAGDPANQDNAAGVIVGAVAGAQAGADGAVAAPQPPIAAMAAGAQQGQAAGFIAGAAIDNALAAQQPPEHILTVNGSGLQPGFKLLFQPLNEVAYQPLTMVDTSHTTPAGGPATRTSSVDITLDDNSWTLVGEGGMLRFVNPDGHFAEQKILPRT